ncbi:MAG: DUF6020 family protein [Peptococcaceae bacterium]|nr:DUF6020 family protein [Peptococcaceae bacterium]
MNIKNIKNIKGIHMTATLFLGLVATFGLYVFLFDGAFSPDHAKMAIWLLLFAALLFPLRQALSNNNRHVQAPSLILSCLFASWLTAGRRLEDAANLLDPDRSLLGQLGSTLFICLGLMITFYALLTPLFSRLLHRHTGAVQEEGIPCTVPPFWGLLTHNRRSFLLVWLFIFVCWLPYFITLYPGVLASDSCHQIQQGVGIEPLHNHHPVIHTAFMALFINVGQGLGSLTLGVAMASVAQMAAMAAIFSFTVYYLAYTRVPRWLRVLILLFFALFPVNAIYSFTLWKDTLFGGITLLLALCLFEAVRRPESLLTHPLRLCGLSVLVFLFCTFRTNGLYAFLLFVPFWLFAWRHHLKKLAIVLVSVIMLVGGYRFLLFSVLHIPDTQAIESLAVPLQQIARTVQGHGEELTEEERVTLSEIFDIDLLPDAYDPRLADPVKIVFKEDAYLADRGKYNSLWLRLLLKYPGTYVNAFLANCYGYWYPDTHYWIIFIGPHDFASLGLDIDIPPWYGKAGFGISLLDLVQRFPSNIPVLSLLYSIGFMVWLVILSAALFIAKGRKHLLLPLIMLGMIWLTTLASPVYAEYRYVYGIMLSAPIFLILAVCVEKRESETLISVESAPNTEPSPHGSDISPP